MVRKQFSPWHAWVLGREMEGTLDQGPEVGVWSITCQRIARGWGIVNDEDYPFDDWTDHTFPLRVSTT